MINVYSPEYTIAHLIQNGITRASATLLLDDEIDTLPLMTKLLSEEPDDFAYSQYLQASEGKDVMSLSSILVSSIWNANDDVFSADNLIAALATPQFKPINWMHNGSEARGNEIIGVMVNTSLMTGSIDALEVVAELDNEDFGQDTSGQLHIRQDGLIWSSYFPSYAKKLRKGIKDEDLYVSMECFFDDFGYAFQKQDGTISLLERNEDNAVLSLALKAFGGSGVVRNRGQLVKVGRWLKKLTFSGQGIVDKPANNKDGKPLSIIITDDKKNKKKKAKTTTYGGTAKLTTDNENYFIITSDFITFPGITDSVYIYDDNPKDNINMSVELETRIKQLEADVKQAQADRDDAIQRLAEAEGTALQAKIEDLEANLTDLTKERDDLIVNASNLREEIDKIEALDVEIVELKKANAQLVDELEQIRALERGRERLDEIKGISDDVDLGYAVEDLAEMSDEAYIAIKKTLEKAIEAGVSSQSKLTDQTVSSQPKLTDQTVSTQTKLTEASVKEDEDVDEAAEAVEDVITNDSDLLVTASHENGNDVARMLVRKMALRQNV